MSFDEKEPIRAVGYTSLTSPAHIHDPDFVRQEVAIARFCLQRDWELVTCLRDIESRRSRAWSRPALIHAVERVRRGDATCLVTAELSRLCPSVADLGTIFTAVETAGGRIVSLDPPLDTGAPVGRAVARALLSVSDWERSRRAERTSAARAKGPVAGSISPELRRRIRRLRGAGITLQGIADILNEEGVPTVRGGTRWRPSSVQTALGYRRPAPLAGLAPAASDRATGRVAGGLV
jgi:DNA invertase Pin-like site-specific DNA recombinase